jgi:octaprenyl-diphosphate synthase
MAEDALRSLVMSDVAAVPEVGGYLIDAGGKRLRPVLTALGARVVGSAPVPRLMCCGELIHLGSLLHDDVVDDGLLRRGKDTTHRVFGNAVTVLTGDFCLARAVLLAAEEGGYAAVTALANAVTAMAEGEVLQLQRAGDLDSNYRDYLEVIERKSAALIAWSAAAAAYAVGDEEAAHALDQYGRAVGVAFQITDDVLDYSPDTGKAPGADLRERKVNLPLLLAMQRIPGLRERLVARAPTPEELPGLMKEIADCGALTDSLDIALGYVDRGIEALSTLPESDGRKALEVLGRYLVERSR